MKIVQTSLFERMKIISLFNQLELGCRNKYKVVSELAKNNFGIIISARTVKRYVDRWNKAYNRCFNRTTIELQYSFESSLF